MQITQKPNIEFIVPVAFVVLLFVIAPLYYQPNWGGRGLELTFNIATWAAASLVCGYASALVLRNQMLRIPNGYEYFLLVPVVVVLVA